MKWKEIKTQVDINSFLSRVNAFHDGYFREIHLWSSYYVLGENDYKGNESFNARILFQGHWANDVSAVELCFSNVQRLNMVGIKKNYWHDISRATLIIEDGLFYWADKREWNTVDTENGEVMWISSKGLKWRDKSEWMGNTLRYGANDEVE